MDLMNIRRQMMGVIAGMAKNIEPFYTGEFEFSTTSTTVVTAATLNIGASAYTSNKVLLIQIRNKEGKRAQHFYGADCFVINPQPERSSPTTCDAFGRITYRFDGSNNGEPLVDWNNYGIYAHSIASNGDLELRARYQSSYSRTIEGTWTVKAYLLDIIGDNPVTAIQ